ncbi:hypothetical protein [uncultured Shimia sp.]|uniref:hypothetical protein n=1 Tax=uncultured Shimia sp. TaxID=573152 RepID=UPI00260D2314|nr:hypothetical protein [uncultured Shimia sp.]
MTFETELASMLERMGPAKNDPTLDHYEIARDILLGDGKRAEAAVAIVWWCEFDQAFCKSVVTKVQGDIDAGWVPPES